jgi:dipeptidase E
MVPGEIAMPTKQLLLLSNSTQYGSGYLEHAAGAIREFLGPRGHVAFVPFALFDWSEYEAKARGRFAEWGYTLESVHHALGDPVHLLTRADAVFIGGGNTFRLLDRLYQTKLLGLIRGFVLSGLRYIGSSAGAIIAGPSLKTTKDMPVVQPPSFDALDLVPFHISPHYLDPDPASTHMGETQEERILQFLEENDGRVVGLREGSLLAVTGDAVTTLGVKAVRLFQRGTAPGECPPGRLEW